MKERKTKTIKERLVDKLGLRIENTNFEPSVDDGRWDDVEWVEHQAELSACDDMLGKLEVGKKV